MFNTSVDLAEYIIYDEGESKFYGDLVVSDSYLNGVYTTISIYKNEEAQNVDLYATIYMNINEIDTNMRESSAVKWTITEGNSINPGDILNEGNFLGASASETLELYSNIELTTTKKEYTIWLWIDKSESPSEELSGETLDTVIWTQVDQVMNERFEITRINANYQLINATVVNSMYKIINYQVTTSSTEPSDWENISSSEQGYNYLLEYMVDEVGKYYVWFKDSEGNVVSKAIEVTEIDDVVPTVSIAAKEKTSGTAISSGNWANEGLNFTLTQGTVGSSGATIYYCQDTANTCTPSTTTTSGTAITSYNTVEGIYYIRYKIVGGSGNSSAVSSYTAKVDLTAPTAPTVISIYDIYGSRSYSSINNLTISSDGVFTTSGTAPYLGYSDIDVITGINGAYVELDADLSSTMEFHSYYAESGFAYDGTNSNGAALIRKVYVPYTNSGDWVNVRYDFGGTSGVSFTPVALGVSATSGQWNRDDVYLHGTSSDDLSGISYWQYSTNSGTSWTNGSSWSTSSTTHTYISSVFTSNNTVLIRACDVAGNCSSSTSTVVNIDTTAPTGSVSVANSSETVTAALSATDTASDVNETIGWKISTSLTCSSSTTDFTDSTNTSYNFTLSEPGTYYVCTKVKDNAGNIAYIRSDAITVTLTLSDSVSIGDYISYTGNNGCSGDQCSGWNANQSAIDTVANRGYCYSSSYKYTTYGWRVLYKTDGYVYIVSAGSPECVTAYDGLPRDSISAFNEISLNYCNSLYLADRVCDDTTAHAFNGDDFYKFTSQYYGSSNARYLYNYDGYGGTYGSPYCYGKSEEYCGLGNDLIDNGGFYWFAAAQNSVALLFWQVNNSRVFHTGYEVTMGLRPVLKLDSSIQKTGGSGTMTDPYTISIRDGVTS